MKDSGTAYLLLVLTFFVGGHHLYLGKPLKAILFVFTGYGFGMWFLYDLFTLEGQVNDYNLKYIALHQPQQQQQQSIVVNVAK